MTDREMTRLTAARNLTDADMMKGLLEANGIPARIEDEESVSMLDAMATQNAGVFVLVSKDQVAEARRILEEAHHRGELEEE